jgi:hypothetical protein
MGLLASPKPFFVRLLFAQQEKQRVECPRRWEFWLAVSVVGFAAFAGVMLWFADGPRPSSDQRLLGRWRLANPRDPKLVRVLEFSRDGTALSFDLSPTSRSTGKGIALRWWTDDARLTIAEDRDHGLAARVRRLLGSDPASESFPIVSIGDDELVLDMQGSADPLVSRRLENRR